MVGKKKLKLGRKKINKVFEKRKIFKVKNVAQRTSTVFKTLLIRGRLCKPEDRVIIAK